MSGITKLVPVLAQSRQVLTFSKLLAAPSRNCGWVRDWKPGPPPTTKEEREAAAKKYNLIPEDYDVYHPSEGYGDYPKLTPVGQDARDPYDDFDMHYRRRNYGEMLNLDYDLYTSERHDPNIKLKYKPWQMFAGFFGFIGTIFALHSLCHYFDIRIVQPMKPKQFPGPGKIHYSFEPLDA
ncbi:NADH dehydrogenase [ubiquinone] 1 beta subcomplex subunit 8, mitochondrial [Halotydeus destructor]|nr:NADH dehydrogenase [ubiquinone] 1 beta subcomplex subunit 8, mitochondrial [Halotydeus destructor]